MKIHNLGFPRIGRKRELKKATEAYWKKEITREELEKVAKNIRIENLKLQQKKKIDLIPVNDFSFYDQVLDMSMLLGIVPERFKSKISSSDPLNLDLIFNIARGIKNTSFTASSMKKWFDTNYHYIVPELDSIENFEFLSRKLFLETKEALDLGVEAKPVLLGPMTFLKISRYHEKENFAKNKYNLFPDLLNFYLKIITELVGMGVKWIQFDEPILSLDLSIEEKKLILNTYEVISKRFEELNVLVANYFGELRDNSDLFLNLPVKAIHLDLVRGERDLEGILKNISRRTILSLGVIDGRNVWKNNFKKSLEMIKKVQTKLPAENIMLAPSCSLIHSPISIKLESKINPSYLEWFSFAEEKIEELVTLKKILTNQESEEKIVAKNESIFQKKKNNPKVFNPTVAENLSKVKKENYSRQSSFQDRIVKQNEILNFPKFPTTTIGSFPQTKEIRQMRLKFKKKLIAKEEYEDFLKKEIEKAIKIQKEIGLDLYVHGEFERNDMVEYFGEKLEGFIFTEFGWVQSYGTRYVKPPIIYGSVARREPMTVAWTLYAQSISDKPIKGMLTGPVTILQWSFCRNDQDRRTTTSEIALALREEVLDLEKNGIQSIQIDEPAIREGLPLRHKDWDDYLAWSIDCFKLATAGVKDETQIHTHMCYSDFNDIIEAISNMDADVISIETSRSKMELLGAFSKFKYPNQIGPGVYDIHSPRIPSTEEMFSLLNKASKVIKRENIWVNPDCGLKTRGWDDVIPSLKNMVKAAEKIRAVS